METQGKGSALPKLLNKLLGERNQNHRDQQRGGCGLFAEDGDHEKEREAEAHRDEPEVVDGPDTGPAHDDTTTHDNDNNGNNSSSRNNNNDPVRVSIRPLEAGVPSSTGARA